MRFPGLLLLVACAGSPAPATTTAPAPVPASGDLALLYTAGDPEPVAVSAGESGFLTADGPVIDAPGNNEWMAGKRLNVVARSGARARVLARYDRVHVLVWVPRDGARAWADRPRVYESFEDEPQAPTLLPPTEVSLPAQTCLYAAPDGELVGVTTTDASWNGALERDRWLRVAVPTQWGDLPLYAYGDGDAWQRCPPTPPDR